jgi:catechol 2,3-dioxygenase-like lactoylglutathione lyase family enzyme
VQSSHVTLKREDRSPVWVRHISVLVSDVDRSARFWREAGMREIERNPNIAVLELRGGTHLVLRLVGRPPVMRPSI